MPTLCRGSFCGAEYAVLDPNALIRVPYWYWLVDVEETGLETIHGPVSLISGMGSIEHRGYLPLFASAR